MTLLDVSCASIAVALTALTLHNAPPVVYPLGRSYFLGGLLLGVWLAGLLSVLAWFYLTWQTGWRMGLGWAAVLAAGVAARSSWNRLPDGQLAWDGNVWRWKNIHSPMDAADYALSVIVDSQAGLLLRLENQACNSLWLWAERRALPERWLDLRRAVYSPHRASSALDSQNELLAEPGSAPLLAVAGSEAMPPSEVSPRKS